MRKAKTENMAEIIAYIVKEIKIGEFVSIRDLMKKVQVTSPEYLENLLRAVAAYHIGRAEKILQTEGKEKARAYAERELVPQVEYCEGHGTMVKEVPLMNIMRENALKRSAKVEDYFKDKQAIVTEESEEIASQPIEA